MNSIVTWIRDKFFPVHNVILSEPDGRIFAKKLVDYLVSMGDEEWSVGYWGREGREIFKRATLVQKPGYFNLEDGLRSRDKIHE